MFIYSAVAVARPGHAQAAREHFVASRALVERETGRTTSAWAGTTGMPLGTMALSARVENMTELLDAHGKLGASSTYNEHSEAGAGLWAAPAETSYQRVIGATSEAAAGDFISMTTALIAGSFGPAIAFATEVMNHVTAVSGSPGILTLTEGGPIGELTWIFSNEGGATMDEADAKLQADADYMALYDRASEFFVPGHTRRSTAVRLG